MKIIQLEKISYVNLRLIIEMMQLKFYIFYLSKSINNKQKMQYSISNIYLMLKTKHKINKVHINH